MSQQHSQQTNHQTDQTPYPLKELLTVAGVAVMFICSIFSLIVFIGGVLFPLWLQVIWDIANIVVSLILFVRAVRFTEYLGDHDPENAVAGVFLCIAVLVGSLICVIGSF